MKKLMKTGNFRYLLAMLVLFLSVMSASAFDMIFDGIFYNLNFATKQASVTYCSTNLKLYSGDVVIPESVPFKGIDYEVTSIGEKAFFCCDRLTSVSIPLTMKNIGAKAFYGCHELSSVTIPRAVTTIGDYAFYSCYGLTEVIIPKGVTTIGAYAFACCWGLSSVIIPDGVYSIGPYAFEGCNRLLKVRFSSIEGLCKIDFKLSVSNPLFYSHVLYVNCAEVTELTIPKDIKCIGNHTFSGCKWLKTVIIPENVKSIGKYSFEHCTGIKTIYMLSPIPPMANANSFEKSTYGNTILYVPAGCQMAYRTAKGWQEFTQIIEM